MENETDIRSPGVLHRQVRQRMFISKIMHERRKNTHPLSIRARFRLEPPSTDAMGENPPARPAYVVPGSERGRYETGNAGLLGSNFLGNRMLASEGGPGRISVARVGSPSRCGGCNTCTELPVAKRQLGKLAVDILDSSRRNPIQGALSAPGHLVAVTEILPTRKVLHEMAGPLCSKQSTRRAKSHRRHQRGARS